MEMIRKDSLRYFESETSCIARFKFLNRANYAESKCSDSLFRRRKKNQFRVASTPEKMDKRTKSNRARRQ